MKIEELEIEYKNILLQLLKDHPKSYGRFLMSNKTDKIKYHEIYLYLLKKYPQLQNHLISEYIYWFIHNLKEFPKCQNEKCNNICDNSTGHSFDLKGNGYTKFCCPKCARTSDSTKQKMKETNIKLYGKANGHSKEINLKCNSTRIKNHTTHSEVLQKFKEENMQKYGCEYHIQRHDVKEKIKKSIKDKYDVDNAFKSDIIKQKIKETNIQRYNTESPMQNHDIVLKGKQTKLKKYGDENYNNSVKQRKTVMTKYGHFNHNYVYEFDKKKFNSSWELAYYIWLKDNNIKFDYPCPIILKYMHNGKEKTYFPDFLVNNQIHEIKGNHLILKQDIFVNMNNDKMNCMQHNNVKIISFNEIKPILKYISQTYGKNYLKQFKIV